MVAASSYVKFLNFISRWYDWKVLSECADFTDFFELLFDLSDFAELYISAFWELDLESIVCLKGDPSVYFALTSYWTVLAWGFSGD
jgi:hypothetical protein